jgi:hypothetical protein
VRSASFLKEACSPIREKRCCEGYLGYFLVLAGWFFSFAFAAETTIYVVVVPLLVGGGSATFSCCVARLLGEESPREHNSDCGQYRRECDQD